MMMVLVWVLLNARITRKHLRRVSRRLLLLLLIPIITIRGTKTKLNQQMRLSQVNRILVVDWIGMAVDGKTVDVARTARMADTVGGHTLDGLEAVHGRYH